MVRSLEMVAHSLSDFRHNEKQLSVCLSVLLARFKVVSVLGDGHVHRAVSRLLHHVFRVLKRLVLVFGNGAVVGPRTLVARFSCRDG